jgi:hypothetical protein
VVALFLCRPDVLFGVVLGFVFLRFFDSGFVVGGAVAKW